MFNAIFNAIFETNYISTRKMPAHLINYIGLNLPDWLCLPSVIIGYIIVTYFQYWAVNKTIAYQENKSLNSIKEAKYDSN